jgi:hypothetical protein
MDTQEKRAPARSNVVDLARIRETRRVPTLLVAALAEPTGARFHMVAPGQLEITLPGSDVQTQIRIKAVNVHRAEALAYQIALLPIPSTVLEAIERWDEDHGITG